MQNNMHMYGMCNTIVQPKPTKASKNGKDILDLNKTIELLNELNYNSENTKKTHIQNIKNVFYVTESNDLLKCLKKPKIIIDYIDNSLKKTTGKSYSINSKKGLIESIVFVITKLNIKLPEKIRQKYTVYFNVLKIKSNEQTENKKIILTLMY